MRKKILIIMAALIFIMPIQSALFSTNVDAAVASKVVNQAAKKVAKEAVKDTAVQMTINMTMDYKYEGKQAREGYTMICLPENRNGSDCTKPMEIKNMTQADKQALGQKVEQNLDKKIAGGIGATRWGKFLSWFAPIFAIGMGFAVIDYAINGDVSDLFDEIAFDSLKDSDFITSSSGDTTFPVDMYSSFVTTEHEKRNFGENWFEDQYTMTVKNGYVWRGYRDFLGGRTESGNILIYAITYDKGKITENYRLVSGTSVYQVSDVYLFDKLSNKIVNVDTSLPNFNETGLTRTNREGKQIPMVAPGALPMEEVGTGLEVLPVRQPDGSTGYQTRTGTKVEEDKVLVKDPQLIPNPNGSTTVVKTPTAENPNPTPSQNGTIPPSTNDPSAPPEFPDGETCTDKLKLPKLGLLFLTLSDSFPFSIPWDLKSGFEALFSEMGTEEPKFIYEFDVMGKPIKWDFKLPEYFKSWIPFTQSILLFTFDVGILYAMYRLIQGGGS